MSRSELKNEIRKATMFFAGAKRWVVITLSVLCAISWGMSPLLKLIEMSGIDGIVRTFENFGLIEIFEPIVVRVILLFFTASILLSKFIKYFFIDHIARILMHSSIFESLSDINKDVIDETYRCKYFKIDQLRLVQKNDIVGALKKQDAIVKRWGRSSSNSLMVYYGIAHTPFVFRAGNTAGSGNNYLILHKKHNATAEFCRLDNLVNQHKYICRKVEGQGEEVVLAISTSYAISDNELKSIDKENKMRKYYFSFRNPKELGLDSINDLGSIRAFVDLIIHTIVVESKKDLISKVHLAIASSVALTFYMGSVWRDTYCPDVVVYHYQNNGYPWGVDMKKPIEECVIKTDIN